MFRSRWIHRSTKSESSGLQVLLRLQFLRTSLQGCDLALHIGHPITQNPDLSISDAGGAPAAGTVNRAGAGGGLRVCPVHPKHDNISEVLDFIICMDSQAKLKNKT